MQQIYITGPKYRGLICEDKEHLLLSFPKSAHAITISKNGIWVAPISQKTMMMLLRISHKIFPPRQIPCSDNELRQLLLSARVVGACKLINDALDAVVVDRCLETLAEELKMPKVQMHIMLKMGFRRPEDPWTD